MRSQRESRTRHCNFPRETEHEIKRGCRIATLHLSSFFFLSPIFPIDARALPPSPLPLTQPSDVSRFIFPFSCAPSWRSLARVLTIIFPREVLSLFCLSLISSFFFCMQFPADCTRRQRRNIRTAILYRRVLKTEKNARCKTCVCFTFFDGKEKREREKDAKK